MYLLNICPIWYRRKKSRSLEYPVYVFCLSSSGVQRLLNMGNSPYCSLFRYVRSPAKLFGLFSFMGGWTFARVTMIVYVEKPMITKRTASMEMCSTVIFRFPDAYAAQARSPVTTAKSATPRLLSFPESPWITLGRSLTIPG